MMSSQPATEYHHTHEHHGAPPSEIEARAMALESLLIEKGLITSDTIDAIVQAYERDIGPMLGAKVVARAWVDPAFKERLLTNASKAITELGIKPVASQHLVVVENTPTVHNVVVCTLCSCYPWAVLGLPPRWYKDVAYRSRVIKEPREVLREFGLELDETVEIRVWDSTSELRYMVLPERPAGTEGWTEEQLAAIVTRDAMIGVARVQVPAPPAT